MTRVSPGSDWRSRKKAFPWPYKETGSNAWFGRASVTSSNYCRDWISWLWRVRACRIKPIRSCWTLSTGTGPNWYENALNPDPFHSGLSIYNQSLAGEPLPFLSELLLLCAYRHTSSRRPVWIMVGTAPALSLSSLASRWNRSGSGSENE